MTCMAVLATRALTALVRQHGGLGVWFDEFEKASIQQVKNTPFKEFDVANEAALIEGALASIQKVFDAVREQFRDA